jgi:hypothetical protein
MPESSGGFLVVLAAEVAENDFDTIAAALREVQGVASVRRYAADPADSGAVERNDARWRESIVHLLDDEGV